VTLTYDVTAERAVLGAVMTGGEGVLAKVRATGITADDFWSDRLRVVWCVACGLADQGKPVDAILLLRELADTGTLDAAGGSPAVTCLPSYCATLTNAPHWAGVVVELARRRRVIQLHSDSAAAAALGDWMTHGDCMSGLLLACEAQPGALADRGGLHVA